MENLEKFFNEQTKVLPKNRAVVGVDLKVSEMFQDLAKVYLMEYERVMRFTTNTSYVLTESDMYGYFYTLIALRMNEIERMQIMQEYQGIKRSLVIPALVAQIITGVGIATDTTYGFEFVPSMKVEVSKLMTVDRMSEISYLLSQANKEGLVCVTTGIPVGNRGDLNLMVVFNIEEELLSYKDGSPLYGFYASFFKHEILSEVLEPKSLRIRYGVQNEYKAVLRQIF